MGLPLEQWRGGGEADGKDAASPPAAGCRTPGGNDNGQTRNCPAAPRKRKAPPGVVSQQQRKDYYNGADVDAFFAAHNL